VRCNSTTLNASTYSTWRAPPQRRSPRGRRPATTSVRASVQRVLDNLAVPAVVYNAEQDLIAANLMGRALFAPHFEADRPNLARFIFLGRRARDYYVDWPPARSMTAAMLRFEAGRDPLNAELTALIGELSTLSPHFRTDWAEQDVHEHRTGHKVYRHPQRRRDHYHFRRIRTARPTRPVHLHLQR
jgi:hypothetical protein